MKNILVGFIVISTLFGSRYYGSTTAPVTLAGAIIKAKNVDSVKKYKRKDCPVCKGKGWYMSGDDITKVDCGYCEPSEGSKLSDNPICNDVECKTKTIRK